MRTCITHSEVTMTTPVHLLLFMYVCYMVDGGAILRLRLIQYTVNGRDWKDKSCDLWINKACDPMFKFCLDHVNGVDTAFDMCKIAGYPQTGYYQGENTVNFMNNGYLRSGQVYNPLEVTLLLYEGFKFKVEVHDDDSGHSGHDLIDRFSYTHNVRPSLSDAQATWTDLTITGTRPKGLPSQFSFSVLLYCEADYYGYGCDVYCVAADSDMDGHYTCDPDSGEVICRVLWENPSDKCRVRIDDCWSYPCQNQGSCIDHYGDYTCVCPPGYTGKDCHINIQECQSNPCQNQGTCIDGVNQYLCFCADGFSGSLCERHVTSCDTRLTCLNGGRCVVDDTGMSCYCPPQYTGTVCQSDMCQVLNCENGGTCGNGECSCPDNYQGNRCEIDTCTEVTCQHGGLCQDGSCLCIPGYTGRQCEERIQCANNPCQHDGTCYTHPTAGYTCSCLPQYNGTHCEERLQSTWSGGSQGNQDDVSDVPQTSQKGPAVWVIVLIAVIVIFIVVMVVIAALFFRYKRSQKRMHTTGAGIVQVASNHSNHDGFSNPAYGDEEENQYNQFNGPSGVGEEVNTYDSLSSTTISSSEGAVSDAYDNPQKISGPFNVSSATRLNFPPVKSTPVKKSELYSTD